MNREGYKVIGKLGNLKIEERTVHNSRIGGYIKVTNEITGECGWKEWRHWAEGLNDRNHIINMLIEDMLKSETFQ